MNIPLISVIVPVYNAEKYLPKCLDSILAQTYKKLEIILVDDGSTDNSGKICDEYALKDSRIKIIHKQNGGVSSARNVALSVAKGEYIGFVDSDDYIDKDMYEYLLELISYSNADIARCYVYEFPPRISNTEVMMPKEAFEKSYPYVYLVNMLFSRICIENIFFDESIAWGEDMQFAIFAFSKANKVVLGYLPKYHYLTNPQSATNQTFNIKKLTYFKIADFVYNYAKENNLSCLCNRVQEQICYHAVGFLRQIIIADYKNKEVISDLQNKVRKGIFKHLFSKHKISNKLFALACSIKFLLAKKLYLLLQGNKK